MNDLRTAAQQALEACEQRLPLKGQAAIIDELNNLRAALAESERDWSMLEAAQEALREHMAEIHRLRAALAQQKDPTDPGNDVDVLREHVRHLERRVRQLHAQQAEPLNLADPAVQKRLASQWGYVPAAAQAEPVEPHRWEGDNNIESPFNACMHKTYCMTLKQAEPVERAMQDAVTTGMGIMRGGERIDPGTIYKPIEGVPV